jgi:anthraniloyl-CoA monooxygenase
MDRVREQFVAAARRAAAAGFDVLEIDLGYGYLLASFLSPLSNRRGDDFGGALKNRLAFPLEVVRAVREVWPAEQALTARLSASDLESGGLAEDEAVEAAAALADAGVELFDVVAGHTTPRFQPASYETAYHAPWADLIRNSAGVPTVCAGNIPTDAEATDVLAAGRADLCVIGRPLPPEPAWLADAAEPHRQGG